jgi:hypothetical protein
LCGFISEGYAQMKHHRERCAQWKLRSNPMEITIARRKQTLGERAVTPVLEYPICIECRKRLDHHEVGCSWNQTEVVRRAAVVKHEIDPEDFEVFLRLLAKRYKR